MDDYEKEVARRNEAEVRRLRSRVRELEEEVRRVQGESDEHEAEAKRLQALVDTPEVYDFVRAVQLEAVHQRQRWGTAHDAGKTDADWFWLIGYLAGKALHNPPPEDNKCGCPTNTEGLRALGIKVAPELANTPEGLATLHLRRCLTQKKLHRIITIAAAAANWHAATLGQTDMRPGTDPQTTWSEAVR